MRHYTCDLCSGPIGELRHVVRIEVTPDFDPDEISEDDLDADHLAEVAALIEKDLNGHSAPREDYSRQVREYDLCNECREKYLADPLGRLISPRFRYSEN